MARTGLEIIGMGRSRWLALSASWFVIVNPDFKPTGLMGCGVYREFETAATRVSLIVLTVWSGEPYTVVLSSADEGTEEAPPPNWPVVLSTSGLYGTLWPELAPTVLLPDVLIVVWYWPGYAMAQRKAHNETRPGPSCPLTKFPFLWNSARLKIGKLRLLIGEYAQFVLQKAPHQRLSNV